MAYVGSLANLMCTIGFDYKGGLLIEGKVISLLKVKGP